VTTRSEDLGWSEGILTIRGAKFGKSRLAPLHTSTCKVLADYAKRRDERFGARAQGYLLVNKAIAWTEARFTGRSTTCPDRLDSVLWMPAATRACTIFGIMPAPRSSDFLHGTLVGGARGELGFGSRPSGGT
jgi:hypothetical protein